MTVARAKNPGPGTVVTNLPPGAGHADSFIVDQDRFFGAISSFVERHVSRRGR
jgi:hypothetical protein